VLELTYCCIYELQVVLIP